MKLNNFYNRQLGAVLCLLLLAMAAFGETKESRAEHPHELSIGVGEGLLLGAMGHGCPPDMTPPPPFEGQPVQVVDEWLKTYYTNELNNRALPHFYVDYQYRLNSVVGLGLQTDFYAHMRKIERVNGYGDSQGIHNTDELGISFLPLVRFTFLHREWVNLYAGAGIGYAMWLDLYDGQTDDIYHSIVFQATPLGLSIGKNHWFATAEIGMTIRPAFGHFFDRLGAISVGYRF